MHQATKRRAWVEHSKKKIMEYLQGDWLVWLQKRIDLCFKTQLLSLLVQLSFTGPTHLTSKEICFRDSTVFNIKFRSLTSSKSPRHQDTSLILDLMSWPNYTFTSFDFWSTNGPRSFGHQKWNRCVMIFDYQILLSK